VLLAAITVYQHALSPALGARCRFEPSCSHYAYEAIATHGSLRGTWLAARRLVRCRPGVPGGYDPVPERPHPAPKQTEPAEAPGRIGKY
jgi:putative membrane protein insertion efficiency factor